MSVRRSRHGRLIRRYLNADEIKYIDSPSGAVGGRIMLVAEQWNKVLADVRAHAECNLSYTIPGKDGDERIAVKSAGEFINVRVHAHDMVGDYVQATCELGKFAVKTAWDGGIIPNCVLTRYWLCKFLTVLLEDCKYDELIITESSDYYYYAKITKVIED